LKLRGNKQERLEATNARLKSEGLMQLDSIGDHTQGEIEILGIVEINEDPDLRGYCMITFECLVSDKETGIPKIIRYSKKFSYGSDKHCGVIIVALTEKDELIMPISYRLGYGWMSEYPRGFPKGHTPLEDARIELASETGYVAKEMVILQTDGNSPNS